jgi:hypothetical protein
MAFLRPDGTIGGGIDVSGLADVRAAINPQLATNNAELSGAGTRDSILDQRFQYFGTPTSYAGVARSGLAATPWVQELAQMGLQRSGDLGQYAAAGPAQLQALQAEA